MSLTKSKTHKFWHKVKLNDGTYTDGWKNIETSMENHLFNDLNFVGKSVLDTGCWDGAYSFEAEKRGASRVISFDRTICVDSRWGGTDGYKFLHNHFNSKCEFVEGNIYHLKNFFDNCEFDIVLCYGVLYHMSDPLLAIQNLFSVCRETIAFEGIFTSTDEPKLDLLIPSFDPDCDQSVIYSPSIGWMNELSKLAGFSLRKIYNKDDSKRKRNAMIYDRIGPATHRFPLRVFPNVV